LLCLALIVVIAATPWLPPTLRDALRHAPVLPEALAAALLVLTALAATALVSRARKRPENGRAISLAARIPQAVAYSVSLPAIPLLAWAAHGIAAASIPQDAAFSLAGGAALFAFALLVMERTLAAASPRILPEAAPLRALTAAAAVCILAVGLATAAKAAGVPYTATVISALCLYIAAMAVELWVRAVGRCFLPAPRPEAATGAVASVLAALATPGGFGATAGTAAVQRNFGIDFSRSWALRYVRAAFAPLAVCLVLLAWVLTGVTLVPIDGRAVYERFGAPVAVLHPGAYLGLPWPLGAARAVEFGAVHEVSLGGAAALEQASPAEAPAPASADRLWEQPHEAEVTLVVASGTAAERRQSFESVSADLRVLYRVGIADADALRAAYAAVDPEAMVRAAAGQVVTDYFAERTLDEVLGANRETMSLRLRERLQASLDAQGSGLQAVDVVIEAIHPPLGAADAYHGVRAAEIAANAKVAEEKGAAAATLAQARQYAFDQAANATAAAAETVADAQAAQIRFTADFAAAKASRPSFVLERYYGALRADLARVPKTIIDHRLNWPEPPVLDLRPYGAPPAAAGALKDE
jgi:regulator of protease activity HflC (stomatin/prohibitin superfamily)